MNERTSEKIIAMIGNKTPETTHNIVTAGMRGKNSETRISVETDWRALKDGME